jgi:hypothetical protein
MATTVYADISYLQKTLYAKGYKPKDLYRKKPLLMAAKKNTDFSSEKGLTVSADSNLGNGVGGTIAGAVTNTTASTGSEFLVTQKSIFGYVEMDSKILRNAKQANDNAKVYDYAKKQYADALETVMFEMSRQAYGTGTGSRGVVLTATGTTITVDPASSIFFRKGMFIGASATDGAALASGTPVSTDPTGFAKITAVDTSTGTITVNGTVTNQITGIVAGWFLYQYTIASNNSTANGGFTGLGGWNPATVSATTFFGVDRTANPAALAGSRYTAGGPLETLFIRAEAQAVTEIGVQWESGDIYVHPQQFAAFLSAKEGSKEISSDDEYKMGIKKLSYKGFTLVQDVCCPLLVAHVVGDEAFTMNTCGNQPQMGDPFEAPDAELIKAKINIDGNFSALPSRLQRITMPTP